MRVLFFLAILYMEITFDTFFSLQGAKHLAHFKELWADLDDIFPIYLCRIKDMHILGMWKAGPSPCILGNVGIWNVWWW